MELEHNQMRVPSEPSGDVNNTNTSSENTPSENKEVAITTQQISDEITVTIEEEEEEEEKSCDCGDCSYLCDVENIPTQIVRVFKPVFSVLKTLMIDIGVTVGDSAREETIA